MKRILAAIGYVLYVSTSWLPHYQLGMRWRPVQLARQLFVKLLFEECGDKVDIGRKISFSSRVALGSHSSIGDNCFFSGKVVIGNSVMIAPQCAFIAMGHNITRTDIPMNMQGEFHKEITIADDVWIGYGATILDGVSIGRGAVVGARAVVTHSIEPYTVVGGVPARIIKNRK